MSSLSRLVLCFSCRFNPFTTPLDFEPDRDSLSRLKITIHAGHAGSHPLSEIGITGTSVSVIHHLVMYTLGASVRAERRGSDNSQRCRGSNYGPRVD